MISILNVFECHCLRNLNGLEKRIVYEIFKEHVRSEWNNETYSKNRYDDLIFFFAYYSVYKIENEYMKTNSSMYTLKYIETGMQINLMFDMENLLEFIINFKRAGNLPTINEASIWD